MLQLYKWRARWSTPQGQKYRNPGRPSKSSSKLQIKNIKLHIVTDIKVNFNSMLGFRISNLVGGKGTLTKQLKIFPHLAWTSASLPVPCHRVTHHAARYPALQKTAASSALVQDQKAYGTRCSQAVPHPSTILARRCLTSVIRRERVCSSWYGRRQHLWNCTHIRTAFTIHMNSHKQIR